MIDPPPNLPKPELKWHNDPVKYYREMYLLSCDNWFRIYDKLCRMMGINPMTREISMHDLLEKVEERVKMANETNLLSKLP